MDITPDPKQWRQEEGKKTKKQFICSKGRPNAQFIEKVVLNKITFIVLYENPSFVNHKALEG